MAQTNLTRVDTYHEKEENFAHVDPLWFANMVDTINDAFTTIEAKIIEIETRLTVGGL